MLDTSAYLSMSYRLPAVGKRGQCGNDDITGDEQGQCGLSYVVFPLGFARRPAMRKRIAKTRNNENTKKNIKADK